MNLKNGIKNRTSCYFYDLINIKDLDPDNILLDQKSYQNISIYSISKKTSYGAKPLRIIFDKVDGFIREYVKTKYLTLFSSEKFESIFNRIRYLLRSKSTILHIVSHNYAKIGIDLNDDTSGNNIEYSSN